MITFIIFKTQLRKHSAIEQILLLETKYGILKMQPSIWKSNLYSIVIVYVKIVRDDSILLEIDIGNDTFQSFRGFSLRLGP